MTPVRVIDTQRLSTLAHEYEGEMVQFLGDLIAIPVENRHRGQAIQRIRQEMEKVAFDEIRIDSTGNILGRIGSGRCIVMMDAHADRGGDPHRGKLEDGYIYGPGCGVRAGMASMVYAGKLIHELGMYDDFTLWVVGSLQKDWLDFLKEDGIRPDGVLFTGPTNLRIHRGRHAAPGLTGAETGMPCRVEKHHSAWLPESHPLVRAAIATYEALFELPPVVDKWTASGRSAGWMGAPAVAFGPGEEIADERVPIHHLVKAAQFYAAFPMMFVDTVRRR